MYKFTHYKSHMLLKCGDMYHTLNQSHEMGQMVKYWGEWQHFFQISGLPIIFCLNRVKRYFT